MDLHEPLAATEQRISRAAHYERRGTDRERKAEADRVVSTFEVLRTSGAIGEEQYEAGERFAADYIVGHRVRITGSYGERIAAAGGTVHDRRTMAHRSYIKACQALASPRLVASLVSCIEQDAGLGSIGKTFGLQQANSRSGAGRATIIIGLEILAVHYGYMHCRPPNAA